MLRIGAGTLSDLKTSEKGWNFSCPREPTLNPFKPLCAQDARGDQCDQCGNLLAAEDLINPKCKLTGTVPVLRPTKHVYLDLPSLTPQLQAYITSSSHAGGWSSNCVQVRLHQSLFFIGFVCKVFKYTNTLNPKSVPVAENTELR